MNLQRNNGYTVADAAKRAGVHPNRVSQLIFWGVLEPEIRRSVGTGNPVLLGERNVKEIKLIDRMKKIGLNRSTIKQIISTLHESKMQWLSKGGWLVCHGKAWFITDNLFEIRNKKFLAESDSLVLVKID